MKKKWKPSKAQRKEFAQNMQNPEFASAYYQKQADKADKRRLKSKFDYESAGGNYVPTRLQYQSAMNFLRVKELTEDQKESCKMVVHAYTLNEKVSHDHIHVVNELIRNDLSKNK